jgi:hypothetical protein
MHDGFPKQQICALWFGRSFFLRSSIKSEFTVEDDHKESFFFAAILLRCAGGRDFGRTEVDGGFPQGGSGRYCGLRQ